MQLGVHFSLNDQEIAPFLAARGDIDTLAKLVETLEEAGLVPSFQSDKAWDPISCALAPEGEDRVQEEWPAYSVILGEEDLADGSDELMVAYLSPETVVAASAWLSALQEEDFTAAYSEMPEGLRNPEFGNDERDYAWGALDDLRGFFADAAEARRHLIFHVNW